ncbi:class F sortase [Umezawaea sp. Da 62-37]|uniref:class F sortase n=1 Tax=Umezawaea sp. Da 62-37 TaxID=3075927 RepID=UPI0028F6CFE8|nr:class F sortase [Umezawaea sp. Da 62-37]WNV82787.1 class F sortase [Umezawaea sp. Da 62-37]
MSKGKVAAAVGALVLFAYVVKPGGDEPTAPRPVSLRIPAIAVDNVVTRTAVDTKTGVLVPPDRADVLGWYADGVAPGDAGPAIIAGHVDSKTGPGVFFRLGDLKAGDQVFVDREDGSAVAFVVDRTYAVEKTAFPTDAVYGPTPASELRLVTCGGTFDHTVSSYRENVIVEAVLAR